MGNEAIAEGAIDAGCEFFAGYPITPASEIMHHILKRFIKLKRDFIQMEDEIASIAAVIGASWAGKKSMTATSGPGFSLMMENIGYAVATETPCVIANIQRAGPSTGQATRTGSADLMQSKWGSHGDYEIIALSPWSVQEMYDLTIEAFYLSEKYRLPVVILADATVARLHESIIINKKAKIYDRKTKKGEPFFLSNKNNEIPFMPKLGTGEKLIVTGTTHDGYGFKKGKSPIAQEELTKHLNNKVIKNIDDIVEIEEISTENAKLIVVCYGIVARAAIKAVKILRKKKYKIGLVRMKTIWPFPDQQLKNIIRDKDYILIPEMNNGQFKREIERISSYQKIIGINQIDGLPILPESIIETIEIMVSRNEIRI